MNGDFIIKLKKFAILAMIALFIIGLIYSIVDYIINAFKKPEPITMEQISEYIKDENLVTDYNTFFRLDKILQQLMDEFVIINNSEKAETELYDVLETEYKKIYSKAEMVEKIKMFINQNYTPKTDDEYLNTEGMLQKAYRMDEYYILQFEDFDGNSEYILIRLLGSQMRYSFNFVEIHGGN